MYVLDFLKGFPNSQQAKETVAFEYRLLCSGELYNGQVITCDWRKSDAARFLFNSPFTLVVCSHPFDEFPQEICLRFSAPSVTEQQGNKSMLLYPDDDIAGDLSALLTLLCRRLITVAAKVREAHPRHYPDEPAAFQDWPIGFVKSLRPVHWRRKPLTLVYSLAGVEKVIDYNPPPLGIDPHHLKQLLLSLPALPLGETIVLAARLYSLALQQLERDVDIAYQLLIAAIEAVANDAFRSYTPTEDEMVETKKSVASRALKFGLSHDEARKLAIEACRGMPWASRKFTKFLLDNTCDKLWEADDLFKVPAALLPAKEDYESAINHIYIARGKLTHSGRPFPPSSSIGVGGTVPTRAFFSYDSSSKPFPPAVWFERVVNCAINSFLERSLGSGIGRVALLENHGNK